MTDNAALEQIRRLWQHSFWADRLVLAGLRKIGTVPPDALREFAHVAAAQEVWLARLLGRASTLVVWPALTLDGLKVLDTIIAGYDDFIAALAPAAVTPRS